MPICGKIDGLQMEINGRKTRSQQNRLSARECETPKVIALKNIRNNWN